MVPKAPPLASRFRAPKWKSKWHSPIGYHTRPPAARIVARPPAEQEKKQGPPPKPQMTTQEAYKRYREAYTRMIQLSREGKGETEEAKKASADYKKYKLLYQQLSRP